MVKLKGKIQASTLIEVVIAMVIVVAVYSASLLIFFNINKSNNNRLKLLAHAQLEAIVAETKIELSLFDEEYELENLNVVKTINPYENIDNISILKVEVFTKQGRLITSREELIK